MAFVRDSDLNSIICLLLDWFPPVAPNPGGIFFFKPSPTIGVNKPMNRIYIGQATEGLIQMKKDGIVVNTCVTSPPYFGLRDYGAKGQIGLEKSPEEYIAALVEVFSRVRDILSDDGTLWINIGDSYAANRGYQVPQAKGGNKHGPAMATGGRSQKAANYGIKPKDLIGIPWMLAFALRADGWYLRQDIIWNKPNPMPESVTDRCTKAHEYVFLLSKKPKYYYNHEAIMEDAITPASSSANNWEREGAISEMLVPGQNHAQHRPKRNPIGGSKSEENGKGSFKTRGGTEYVPTEESMRNKRSVWTIATKPYKGAHFAVFPEALITPCILAGCPPGGIVLDPFMGSGTTASVAIQNGMGFAGCELNHNFVKLQKERLGLFAGDTEWI